MGFFEGLESDIRSGQRPILLRVAFWLLGAWERLRARLRIR